MIDFILPQAEMDKIPLDQRAVLVGRKSQVRVAADADTVERQFEDGDRHCANYRDGNGAPKPLTVVARFYDLESGYKDKSKAARAGLMESMKWLEESKAMHLVVARFDRLTRQGPKISRQYADRITDAGGHLHVLDFPKMGPIDLSDGFGEFLFYLWSWLARQWSDTTSKNVKRANLTTASRGDRHGGKRPYGWHMAIKTEVDEEGNLRSNNCPTCGVDMPLMDPKESGGRRKAVIELCPEEAKILREGARRLVEGESLRKIVTDFNKRGLKTANGSEWVGGTLSRALRSPAMSGKRTHLGVEYTGKRILDGVEYDDGAFPAILTPEEHAEVLARLATNGSGRPLGPQTLLTAMDLLHCDCGAVMVSGGGAKAGGPARYRCNGTSPGHSGCGKIYVVQHRVDQEVVRQAMSGLKVWREKHGKPEGRPQLERWQEQLEADEEQMKRLTYNCYTDTNHPLYGNDEAFKAAFVPLKKRAGDLKALISAAAPQATVSQESVFVPDDPRISVETWWEGKSLVEKRAILSYYLKKVTIRPSGRTGPTFNPKRVHVEWHSEKLWGEVAPILSTVDMTEEEIADADSLRDELYQEKMKELQADWDDAYRLATEE